MKKVYLIRHCLPDFPDGQRMCLGITDLPLGPEGLAQAERVAAALPAVSAVFSSPLSRAKQTAQAIGMPITVLADLRELDAGEWDGLTFPQIRERYPVLFAARDTQPDLPLPGGEDHAQGLARFFRAMNEAAQRSSGDLAVVAHGGIIAEFLRSVTGVRRKPAYGEIIPLYWENEKFYVQEDGNHA